MRHTIILERNFKLARLKISTATIEIRMEGPQKKLKIEL